MVLVVSVQTEARGLSFDPSVGILETVLRTRRHPRCLGPDEETVRAVPKARDSHCRVNFAVSKVVKVHTMSDYPPLLVPLGGRTQVRTYESSAQSATGRLSGECGPPARPGNAPWHMRVP
ncbi:hypothetical protein GCM10010206_60850 [Streptomyces cinerochromogenes]|nr:hypothetical protein GCM10010206_60850 [Streptomyces cinerochromogenes]